MEIRLDGTEAKVLLEVLEADISRLLLEIAHTDNRQMREGLRRREEVVKAIIDRLAGEVRGAA